MPWSGVWRGRHLRVDHGVAGGGGSTVVVEEEEASCNSGRLTIVSFGGTLWLDPSHSVQKVGHSMAWHCGVRQLNLTTKFLTVSVVDMFRPVTSQSSHISCSQKYRKYILAWTCPPPSELVATDSPQGFSRDNALAEATPSGSTVPLPHSPTSLRELRVYLIIHNDHHHQALSRNEKYKSAVERTRPLESDLHGGAQYEGS